MYINYIPSSSLPSSPLLCNFHVISVSILQFLKEFMAASPSSAIMCSICLEEAFENCPRTVVTLHCKHTFHLDCIGSAFNAKGRMECPNCRAIGPGVWRQKTSDDDEPHQEFEMVHRYPYSLRSRPTMMSGN